MTRYRLTIEYDGAGFVGWQRQDNGPSIQQALEQALEAFCGERAAVAGAGRTDAGVHALAQVAHVDLEKETAADTLRDALNYHLQPAPIAVLDAARVPDDFHARFSAAERHYLYRILDRRPPLALTRGRAWRLPQKLDVTAMSVAAQRLIGRHDFTTFRAAQCQAKSPVKTLDTLDVERRGEEVHISARARSFLHHQVRSIVGSLAQVGLGRWDSDALAAALAACDRSRCGPVAPAHGLYLAGVVYPDGEN